MPTVALLPLVLLVPVAERLADLERTVGALAENVGRGHRVVDRAGDLRRAGVARVRLQEEYRQPTVVHDRSHVIPRLARVRAQGESTTDHRRTSLSVTSVALRALTRTPTYVPNPNPETYAAIITGWWSASPSPRHVTSAARQDQAAAVFARFASLACTQNTQASS